MVIYKAFSLFYQLVFCSCILQSELAVRNENWEWVLLAKDCVLFTWRCWPPLADRPCVEIRWRVFADAQRVRGCRFERPGRLEVWVVLPQHFPGKLLTPTPYSREKERPEEHQPLLPPPSCIIFEKHLQNTGKQRENVCKTEKFCTLRALFPFYFSSFLLFLFLSLRAFFGAKDWRIGGRTLQVQGAPGDSSLIASQTNRGTCSPAQRLDGIGAFALRSITAHSGAILPFFNASLK